MALILDLRARLYAGVRSADYDHFFVGVVEVTELRAIAVEQAVNAPVGNLRVVPQGIRRILRTVNLGDGEQVR